jgi:hypothetical protein
MKKVFGFIRILIIFAAIFVFASCRNQLVFTLLEDDTIAFDVECNFDQSGAIQKLLQSVGTDFSELNLDELKSGLEEEGFTKVQVYPSKTEGLVIKGIVPENNDIVFQKDGIITFRLTQENFRDFYNGSSARIAAVFDMFLVPVLSDDEELQALDEKGYLDLVASFYGQSFADELSKSSMKISVQDKKKNTTEKTIYFASLFTARKPVEIKSQN